MGQKTRERGAAHRENSGDLKRVPQIRADLCMRVRSYRSQDRTTWKDWGSQQPASIQGWEQCLPPPARLKTLETVRRWTQCVRALHQRQGVVSTRCNAAWCCLTNTKRLTSQEKDVLAEGCEHLCNIFSLAAF